MTSHNVKGPSRPGRPSRSGKPSRLIPLLVGLAILPSCASQDAPTPMGTPTPVAKTAYPAAAGTTVPPEFAKLVRQAIMDDPHIVLDATKKLQEEQVAVVQDKTRQLVDQNADALFNDPRDEVIGPEASGVGVPTAGLAAPAGLAAGPVIVMFYDYQCPYCKAEDTVLATLRQRYPDLRIILKPIAILGPLSDYTSHLSQAAMLQGKFKPFHAALLADRSPEGKLTEARVIEIAQSVGLDTKKLVNDAKNPVIDRKLDDNLALAKKLGIQGTPGLVVSVSATGSVSTSNRYASITYELLPLEMLNDIVKKARQ